MKTRFKHLLAIPILVLPGLIHAQQNFYKEYKPDNQGAAKPASIIVANNHYFFSDADNSLYKIDSDGNLIWYKENNPLGFGGFSNLFFQNHQLAYDNVNDHIIMVGNSVHSAAQFPTYNWDYGTYSRLDATSGGYVLSEYVYGYDSNGSDLIVYGSTTPEQSMICVDVNANGNVFAAGKSAFHVNTVKNGYEDYSYIGGKLEYFNKWGYQRGTLGKDPESFWVDMQYDDQLSSTGIISVGNDSEGDVHICKYDDNGGYVWGAQIEHEWYDLKVNAMELVQGDVIVVGEYDDGQSAVGFAARYNASSGNVAWMKTYSTPELIEVEINRSGQLAVLYNNGGYSGSGLMIISAFGGDVYTARSLPYWQYSDFTVDVDGSYILLGLNENNINTTSDDEIIVWKIEEDLATCETDVNVEVSSQNITATAYAVGNGYHYEIDQSQQHFYSSSLEPVTNDLVCCSENLNLFPNATVWYCIGSPTANVTIDLVDYGYVSSGGETIRFYDINGNLLQTGSSTSVVLSMLANTCSILKVEVEIPGEICMFTDILDFCVTDGSVPVPPSKKDVYCSSASTIELPGSTFGQNFSVQYYDLVSGPIANNTINVSAYGLGTHTIVKEITDIYTGCTSQHFYEFEIISCNCGSSLEWQIDDNISECSFTTSSTSAIPANLGIKRYRYSIRSTTLGISWTVIADVDNQVPFPFTYNYANGFFGGFSAGMYEIKIEVWYYLANSDDAVICGYFTDTKTHEIQECNLLKNAKTGGIQQGNSLELVSVSIVPNPSSGIFEIKSLPEGATIQVIDMLGRSILNNKNTSADFNKIDLSSYENGIYMLRISYNGNLQSIRLVKN